jgi:hypothetical protein
MFSRHFAILALLAGLPAIAQEPATTISPSTTGRAMRSHAPMRLYGVPAPGSVQSTNWSGYAVTGTKFTKALGSWIVPKVSCSTTPNSYSSYWVGIDGFTSNTVEQLGTDSDCAGTTPTYYAWYEFFPNPSHLLPGLTVSPGDKMSATVLYSGSQFTLRMTNHTTGKAVKIVKTMTSQRTSAEWIAEAPSNGVSILPLADFIRVSLGDDYTGVNDTNWAIDGAVTGPISDFGVNVQKITMVTNGGANKAVPTALTTDGSSFKVTWKHE